MCHHVEQLAIVLLVGVTTTILPPRTFIGVSHQIWPGDVMVRPEFGTAEAREIGFGPIGRSIAFRISFTVVDHLECIAGSDAAKVRGLIGKHLASRINDLLDDPRGFMFVHGKSPAAAITFTEDRHTLTLARPVRYASAILTQRPIVSRADVTTEVGPVDLDLATESSSVLVGRDRLAELVRPHECGLVGHLKFLAHANGTETLRRIDEVSDQQEQIAIGQLAAGEDRAGSR